MTFITCYLLIAATTGIAAVYELFYPAVQTLELVNPDNLIVQQKSLSLFVMGLMAMLFMPVVLPVILVPSWTSTALDSLVRAWQD